MSQIGLLLFCMLLFVTLFFGTLASLFDYHPILPLAVIGVLPPCVFLRRAGYDYDEVKEWTYEIYEAFNLLQYKTGLAWLSPNEVHRAFAPLIFALIRMNT